MVTYANTYLITNTDKIVDYSFNACSTTATLHAIGIDAYDYTWNYNKYITITPKLPAQGCPQNTHTDLT